MRIFTGACQSRPWPTDSTYHTPAAARIAASLSTMSMLIIHGPSTVKAQLELIWLFPG